MEENQPTKRKATLLKDLSFHPGETNPLLFLAEFEKCLEVKTDQDKMQKLRNFVDAEHKRKDIFSLFSYFLGSFFSS